MHVTWIHLFFKPWMQKPHWERLKSSVSFLADELNKIVVQMVNDKARHRAARSNSEKSVADESWSSEEIKSNCSSVWWKEDNHAKKIKEKFEAKDEYECLSVNDLLPELAFPRYCFVKKLVKYGLPIKENVHLMLYTYSHGGNLENLRFAWLVPADPGARSPDDQRKAERNCENTVPVYHSRLLKRKFIQLAEDMNINDKAKLRKLYQYATGDSSAARTSAEREVDDRLMEYVMLRDETIIYDLRALNHRPHHFEDFFNAAERVINATVETAVDDRRHGDVHEGMDVVHMATAISAADLHK